MNFNEFDFNLDNYSLKELLELFNLSYNFNEDDLKKAKRIALNTHPDKSKLPKDVFLFFSKAYKQIFKIYEFRKNKTKNTTYTIDKDEEKERFLKNFLERKDFNLWFNEMWNKSNISFNSNGYGNWMKNESTENLEHLTKEQQTNYINNKKRELQSLIKNNDINETETTHGHSLLCDDECNLYQSDVFSKFKYDDLKHVHTETVIPVSEDLINNRQNFNSVNDLSAFRNKQISVMSDDESNKQLKYNNESMNKSNINRAYKLLRQDEKIDNINK